MIFKAIKDEDFSNYKFPSMFIGFPNCTFKCDKEVGKQVCQNSTLATSLSHEADTREIVGRYIRNKLTSAIVIGGLEPFDDYGQLLDTIKTFREYTDDDIVIYTGYYKAEIKCLVAGLSEYKNIIIKFGRYIPSQLEHYDEVLGVYLASDNQYAERIS